MKSDCFGDPLPRGAMLRLGTTRLRHGFVNSVAFGPKGDWLVSAGSDNEIRVWDSKTGKEIASFRVDSSTADVFGNTGRAAAASPDGDLIAASALGGNNRIYLYSLSRRKIVAELTADTMECIESLAFSPDGKLLACAGLRSGVYLWDVAKKRLARTLPIPKEGIGSMRLAFTPDGRTLVVAQKDEVQLWDVMSGKQTRTTRFKNREIESIDVSPDGKLLAFVEGYPGRLEFVVTLCSLPVCKKLRELASDKDMYSVRFLPDGKTVAGAGEYVSFWDCATGKFLRRLEGKGYHGCANPGAFAFSPDGRTMASHLDLWDVRTFKKRGGQFRAHDGNVQVVRFLPGKGGILTGSDDGTLRRWDPKTGKQREVIEPGGACAAITVSADGRRLACTWAPHILDCYDIQKGKQYALVKPRKGEKAVDCIFIGCIAFSPDGAILASGDDRKDIVLWDAAKGKKLLTLRGHSDGIKCLTFCPSGKTLVSGSFDKEIRFWDVSTGRETACLKGHEECIGALAVSPDGKRLASGTRSYGVMKLWDLPAGKPMAEAKVAELDGFGCMEFSPDGALLAWAYRYDLDTRVHLWDVAKWKEVGCLKGHRGTVGCLAFSEDGKLLASGSEDSTALIWDVAGAMRRVKK